jgi:hypothetical protein
MVSFCEHSVSSCSQIGRSCNDIMCGVLLSLRRPSGDVVGSVFADAVACGGTVFVSWDAVVSLWLGAIECCAGLILCGKGPSRVLCGP